MPEAFSPCSGSRAVFTCFLTPLKTREARLVLGVRSLGGDLRIGAHGYFPSLCHSLLRLCRPRLMEALNLPSPASLLGLFNFGSFLCKYLRVLKRCQHPCGCGIQVEMWPERGRLRNRGSCRRGCYGQGKGTREGIPAFGLTTLQRGYRSR